jgi:tRNA pseudouridine55 synthase
VDEDGAGAVLAALTTTADDDLTAAVLEELLRRHRRVASGTVAVPLAWRAAARAGGRAAVLAALVGLDVPVAVVSACTLLDRPPGPVVRARAERLADRLAAGLVADPGHLPGPGARWAEVERLWALRGQPAAAAQERSELDRRVARRLAAGGIDPPPGGPGESPDGMGYDSAAECAVTAGTTDRATTSGLVVVAKPGGLTSHDVVARLRRILRTRKVGHAGTLDPMATGVLVCGVGRGTKLLGHLALDTKAYTATIRLGASTTTDDAEGEVLATADASDVPDTAIATGIAALTGPIEQVPSSVSAIKVGGKRAYAMVRAGETVELPARPVTVSEFALLARRPGEGGAVDLDVRVGCSSGTYVRALARDLGAALGVGGHLTALHRTRVGPFTDEHARTLEQLEAEPAVSLPLDEAVAVAFTRRDLDAERAADIAHGRPLPPAGLPGTYGVFGPDGGVIALVSERDGLARPVVVLTPA